VTAVLEVSGLEAAYGQSQVLFGLDLTIKAGEVATLLGRNGMGKTTTVRAILGLTPPRSGNVRFRGQSLRYASPDRIARAGRQVRRARDLSRDKRIGRWRRLLRRGAGDEGEHGGPRGARIPTEVPHRFSSRLGM